jgi:hypothetical protein
VAAAVFLAGLPDHRPPASPSSSESAAVGVGRDMRAISLGGARTDALLVRVRADLDDSVAAVERFWGADWPREIPVVAAGSDAEFVGQANLDPRRRWTDIAAVSVADDVDVARRQASGQRIVLAPGASAMSDSALRIVLAHELFHFAARADTAMDAPRWITEGVADFVARPSAPLPPGAGATVALPSDADLDGSGRSAGYDRAWWFARFIADTYGVDGLRRLYVSACGAGHGDLATAVRRALDTDLSDVQARWAVWLNR